MMTYDEKTRTIRIEEKYLRCIGVVKGQDASGGTSEQPVRAFVGGYEILLELPKDGANKATLRGASGICSVSVKPSKEEPLRITKTTLHVGELVDGFDGLPALLAALEDEGNMYRREIESLIEHLAIRNELFPDYDSNFVVEEKKLRAMYSFEFNKNYSHLYSDVIQKAM